MRLNLHSQIEVSYRVDSEWYDIAATVQRLDVIRDGIAPGILSATLISDDLDPAVSETLRPNLRVRVRVSSDLLEDTAAGQDYLFQGRMTKAEVTYEHNRQARIELTALDAMARIMDRPGSSGYWQIGALGQLLAAEAGIGDPIIIIPAYVNGVENEPNGATPVVSTDDATVLDQLAMLRDSAKAYIWLDKTGVMQGWSWTLIPDTVTATFSDVPLAGVVPYSKIDAVFATDDVINLLDIVVLQDNGAGTIEIEFGPFFDLDSQTEWGVRQKTLTIYNPLGTLNDSDFEPWADRIFASQAEPSIKVKSVTVPVKDIDALRAVCNLDLYSLVNVVKQNRLDQDYRIQGIQHRVFTRHMRGGTRVVWFTDFKFTGPDTLARPLASDVTGSPFERTP